jgi:hypothetical protein
MTGPRASELPALVRGWTTGDRRPLGSGALTHAVRPDPWPTTPPMAGETLCGRYAYLDRQRRPFDPTADGACPACLAALDAAP